MPTKFDQQTVFSWAVVATLIGAAVTFGIMHQKVETQAKDIHEIKEDIKNISYQVQGVEELKMLIRDKYARASCEVDLHN